MSDFLLVAPSDWTELPEFANIVAQGLETPETVAFTIEQEAWGDLDQMLTNAALLQEGQHVSNARLVRVTDGYRFWVQYA